MLAIPAIDLRSGHVVQLVGGDFANEAVRLADPLAVARRWVDAGFRRLHIVDLDAAASRGSNREVIADLLRERESGTPSTMQVGGGIRTTSAANDLLRDGADQVIVGTRALEEPAWLAEIAAANPGRVIVAADVRGRHVVTHAWSRTTQRTILDVVADLASLGGTLGGLLVTAVHREGQLQGTDLPLMEEVVNKVSGAWPLLASGGITTLDDLRALSNCGVAGAVLGMALYTGTLDPRTVAEEFAS